eukprot:g42721.t1
MANLLEIFEDVSSGIDKGEPVDVVYLDFQKAFDYIAQRGPDELHPRVLKEIAEETVEVLMVFFQESLDSGRVLENWKIANVTPLFKKGLRQKTENYRQISLISVV